MPWFFVDDAFADSKPVMQLERSLRNAAIGLWVRCGAWSAKEETDGHVGLDTVKQFGGTPRLIKALHEQSGLWVENSPESWRISREIVFGNWEKWQKTRAENLARRKREAEKKSTYRSGKKGRGFVPASDDSEVSTGDTSGDISGDSENMSTGDSVGESLYPDPTRPDPVVSTDVDTTSSGKPRKRRAPRIPLPEGFYPTAATVDKIREEFPGVSNDDLNYQHRKFCDHAVQNNRLCAGERGWNAAWCNWMRTADERNELRRRMRNGAPPATRKVGVGLELANRLGNTTPELTA